MKINNTVNKGLIKVRTYTRTRIYTIICPAVYYLIVIQSTWILREKGEAKGEKVREREARGKGREGERERSERTNHFIFLCDLIIIWRDNICSSRVIF